MTIPCGFARGAIPGTLPLVSAPLTIVAGLVVTARSPRNAA
jgi:hypothetical protein